jgi:ring-1,2-phenylacetyl-CoA epoxidase subunit PaaE
MFLEELADLKDRYPSRFRLVHVLSREPQEVELFSGRIDREKVQRLFETLVPPEAVDDWFLCGPLDMVTAIRSTLRDAGVARERIHLELFHVEGEPVRVATTPAPASLDSGTSSVTVVLDGRASTFSMARGEPRILDAALGVRSDAPYACKGGVCGTCRARLVEGRVEMDRNYALERDEVEAGFVLACQSRPISDTVVIDFDT